MTQLESVLTAAFELSVNDRVKLIDALAASVPETEWDEFMPEMVAEFERRSDEVDQGTVKTVTWEDVKSELKKSLE
jgi:putative addiction module component (TIGR02574 family)